MSDRNKIAQALSVEELEAFLKMLFTLPGAQRTYEAIKRRAFEDLGLSISIESAKSFRNTTFAKYVKRTERRREFAERIATLPATGAKFADAAGENLAELVFDATEEMAEIADEGGSLDLKKAGSMAFIISKIRQGDVARSALQLKINDFERKDRERDEKTAQAAAQLEKLRDPSAGLNAQERSTVLDTIDDLLGIKKKA